MKSIVKTVIAMAIFVTVVYLGWQIYEEGIPPYIQDRATEFVEKAVEKTKEVSQKLKTKKEQATHRDKDTTIDKEDEKLTKMALNDEEVSSHLAEEPQASDSSDITADDGLKRMEELYGQALSVLEEIFKNE